MKMNLSDLGYEEFCIGEHHTGDNEDHAPARVVGMHKDSYLIHDGSRQIRAVLAALQTGEIDEKRYENYLRLGREIAHNQMSLAEKRRKDKEFGKMCKNIIKKDKKTLIGRF